MNLKKFYLFVLLSALLAPGPKLYAQCNTTDIPYMYDGCVFGDAIDAFTLNSITTSGNYGCQSLSTAYKSYTTSRTLTIGSTYSFSATVGTSGSIPYNEYFAIWIDYNGNGKYNGTGEVAWASTGKSTSHSGTITVPNNASPGTVAMRTRCKYDGPAFSTAAHACADDDYGETEDYTVTLVCPTPTVTVTANPGNTICAGTSVTFTASPADAGTSITYQWKKNNVNVGTNSATYTDAGLVNGDAITCKITTAFTCAPNATSNTVTMTVNPIVTPSVSIAPSPSGAVCPNTSVTFTATPTNGGATPSYQWKKNSTNVGTNSSTYTNASWSNGDAVSVVMTSNAPCPTGGNAVATSSTTTMTVNAVVTPSVSIAVSPGNSFCPGTNATFTATPTNGGTPAYQWKKNGSNVGTNSATYSDNTLTTGDVVTCVMTSSVPCPTGGIAAVTSNGITINTSFPASATITQSTPSTTICSGTSVTFTATPTNGGTPTYQWKKNGGNVGTNSNTYTDVPGNGDAYSVQMTSSIACASPKPATSNTITMVHAVPVVPSVSITGNPNGAICPGVAVQFTATPTNGGFTPSYQWKVNGNNVGTNSASYSNGGTLNNNDIVSVVMTPSICASPTTATGTKTMTVTPFTVPVVSISANPGNSICAGTSVTFTANATNAGTTPTYQWKKNNINIGTNSATFTSTTLNNFDVITCEVTAQATCAGKTTSNAITMNVTPVLTPSVSIASSTGTPACQGVAINFTATPTNAGNTPSYQWKVNGNNVGTNNALYANPGTLAPGANTITCVVTNSYSCPGAPTATGTFTQNITQTVTPSVSISAPGNGNVCQSASVTLTATPVNGGASPTYQWKKNGSNVATGASWNAGTSLVTGDVVTCVMTSNAPCTFPSANATSNAINITVYQNTTTAVTIASDVPPNLGCTSLPVTFTATPVNGGPTPSYQWKKNSVNVGTNSPTYTDATLATGNTITCTMTTSQPCATPASTTSNTITMTMNPILPVSVTITANPDSVGCSGGPFSFTSFFTNGGSTPTYQWYKNGSPIQGSVQSVYSSNSLNDGDVISLKMSSSLACAFPVMSNSIGIHLTPTVKPTLAIVGLLTPTGGINFTANLTDGGSNPTYQWRKNSVDIQGATFPSYTMEKSEISPLDKINLFVHSTAPCADPEFLLSNTINAYQVVSVGDISSIFDGLNLFPNPNGGKFTVSGTLKKQGIADASIEVLNGIGAVVYRDVVKITKGELNAKIDMSDRLAAGMYMIRVTVDDKTQNLRFIVK